MDTELHNFFQTVAGLANVLLNQKTSFQEANLDQSKIAKILSSAQKVKEFSERRLKNGRYEANQLRVKKHQDAMAYVRLLHLCWPEAFPEETAHYYPPLYVGINHEIYSKFQDRLASKIGIPSHQINVDNQALSKALFHWTRQKKYLRSIVYMNYRIDLEGNPIEYVTKPQAEKARVDELILEARRQNQDASRKQKMEEKIKSLQEQGITRLCSDK